MRLACRTLLLTTAALSLALGAIPVGAQTGTASSNLSAAFKAADKNGDGRLDREEFRQAAIEGFYFRDKEHKGYLTADQLPEASPAAFKAANVKGDGRLSMQEEVSAMLKDFDVADVDKDGTLSFAEFEAYVKRSSR
jgi:Ca2+-binding EF-hand superfamily protein